MRLISGKTLLAVLLSVYGIFGTAWAKPPYPVIGYLPTYENNPLGGGINVNLLPWVDLTHVYEAFLLPNGNGTLQTGSFTSRANLITTTHTNSTRIYISIGGANPASNSSNFSSSISPTYESTFVTNIVNFVTANGYDGVDIDWEFPASGDKTNFTTFMTDLYTALRAHNGYDSQPLGLTFFTSAGSQVCGVDWVNVQNHCDYAIYSGYDFYDGCDYFNAPLVNTGCNSTDCGGYSYELSLKGSGGKLGTIHKLGTDYGWPLNKLILGMPLYASQSNTAVINVLKSGTFVSYNVSAAEAVYTYGSSVTINTVQSFCDKMNWAFGQSPALPGIALWDISYAYPPTDASVTQLWSTIAGSNCVTVLPGNTSTPTNTPTSTPTKTSTSTPTFTVTRTPSSTPTLTATQTPTSTFTRTPTITPSYTATSTATASPTATPTSSPTLTATLTPSPTVTDTPQFSYTPTSTPTFTPTSTATSTATASATSSPTMTPSATASQTPTGTPTDTGLPTNTPTLTATATPTSTPSLTATFTASPTITNTSTPTVTMTPSATPTLTPTASPSFTPSLTMTSTVSPTATNAVAASAGGMALYPNPVFGTGPVTLVVSLPNGGDVTVKLFTTAFRKVIEKDLGQNPAGNLMIPVDLKDKSGVPLADGLYYVVVNAPQGRLVAKLLILR